MGNLRVRQTVNINSGGSGGGLAALLPIAGLVVVAYVVLSAVAAAIHALMVLLIVVMIVFSVALVAGIALLAVFRGKIRSCMVRRGDPRDEYDQITAEKRRELARIRAMRLQLEAARIAGVEITPDMLAMAEDPELAELVWRFKAAANGTDRWLSGPRGGE